jgi:hypothetical protein
MVFALGERSYTARVKEQKKSGAAAHDQIKIR